MIREDIIKDTHFQDFLNSRQVRKSTKEQYISRIFKYCIFLDKTPSELIEEAEDEEEKKIRMKNRHIKKYLNDFLHHLIDKKKSPSYIRDFLITVRSFYSEFEVEIPKIRLKHENTKRMITTDDIVGKKHILRALEHCNLKYKSIILLMSSSGMGKAEIIHLTYNDFLNAISEYYKPSINEQFDIYLLAEKIREQITDMIPTWQIKRHKTNMPFITFSSPESTQSVIYYLLERMKKNKPITNLDDPLFEANGHQVDSNSFSIYFLGINDKCDYGFVGYHRFFTSHKLRKYFASTLNKNNVPEISTQWMLGHSIDRVTDAYFKLDINALKEQYKRVVKDLSIEKVITREITTKEYDNILEELRKEREIRDEENKTTDKEMAEMSKRVKLLEQLLSDEEYAKERIKEK